MNINKIFKWGMVVLIAISVAILVWGFAAGWPKIGQPANAPVNALLTWAVIMVGLALFCWVIIGLIKSISNDPKNLVKIGLVLVGAVVLCLVAFLFAKGNPAIGYTGKPVTEGQLKLTDTILNLSYITGAAAIVAIIVGEIRMSTASKKK